MAEQDAPWGIVEPDQTEQTLDIARKRALANALMQQSMEQQDPARLASPGGYVVKFSPMQGLAQLAKAYAGNRIGSRADKSEAELARQKLDYKRALARSLAGDDPQAQAAFALDPSGAAKGYWENKYRKPETVPQPAADVQEYKIWEEQGGKGGLAGFMRFKAGLAPAAKADAAVDKPKAMPPSVIKQLNTSREALRAAQQIETTLRDTRAMVSGKDATGAATGAPANIGPVARAEGAVRNWLGTADENTRSLQELKRVRSKLRNDYLMLAKGVQTEGDATRAMDAMMPDTNDRATLLEQLDRVAEASEALQRQHLESMNFIEQEYGRPMTEGAPQPAAAGGAAAGGKKYVRTGRDKKTGKRVGQLADGSVEALE